MSFAGVILVSAVMMAQTGAQPADQLRDEVRKLARQLGHDELAVREKAEQALMQMGVAALPHLPVPNERMLPEMRQRIERIRERLQVQQAEMATEGTRVTLTANQQPLSAVLKQLETQTGNKIVDFRSFRGQPQNDPPITVAFKDVPFWQALDQVLQQAKLTTYPYAIDDEGEPLKGIGYVAALEGGNPRAQHACYQGLFRFQPLNVIARRDLREPFASGLELEVEVTWEPRLTPIVLTVLGDSVQAVDNFDKPVPLRVTGQRSVEVQGSVSTFPLLFQLPSQDASEIKSLRGNLSGLVPARLETFRFEKLTVAKKQQQKKAGVAVMLDEVRKNQDVWELRVRVRLERSDAKLESHLMDWVMENEAYLQTADGQVIEPDTLEKTREVDDEFGVAYMFGLEGDLTDYSFVYKTPASLLLKEIPFQFSDIQLP